MDRTRAAPHDHEKVLRLLGSQGPLSERQLVRRTHLTRDRVAVVIQDLTGLELISERTLPPTTETTLPEPLLGLDPGSAWTVGLDLHVTRTKLCLIDGAGHIIAQERFPPRENITRLASTLPSIIDNHAQRLELSLDRFAGVGVSVPGAVNPVAGTVTKPTWNWQEFPLADLLKKSVGRPVHIERDATCGAYGEKHAGRARKCDHFLYLLVHPRREKRDGLASQAYCYGLAIIIDGHAHRGFNYAAGEFDHVLALDLNDVEMPFDAEGNPDQEVIPRLLHAIGQTTASLTNLIDPEMIVLCADHDLFTRERLAEIEKTARQNIFNVEARRFRLVHSTIGMDGLVYGAALLRLHRHFRERLAALSGNNSHNG